MGFDDIFRKTLTKNAALPKISILLEFGGETLALLCSVTLTQTLIKHEGKNIPQFHRL